MKNTFHKITLLIVTVILAYSNAFAQLRSSNFYNKPSNKGFSMNSLKGWAAGVKYHVANNLFAELPYDDGDLSYIVGYNSSEQNASVLFAIGYAPDVTGTNYNGTMIAGSFLNGDIDSTITLIGNYLIKDGSYRGGLGIEKTYIKDTYGSHEWTDIYWQILLGLNMPMGGVDIDLLAYYEFDSWSNLDEADLDNIGFTVIVNF